MYIKCDICDFCVMYNIFQDLFLFVSYNEKNMI